MRGRAAIRRFVADMPQSPGSSGPLDAPRSICFSGFPRGAIKVQSEKFALGGHRENTADSPTKTARAESLSLRVQTVRFALPKHERSSQALYQAERGRCGE